MRKLLLLGLICVGGSCYGQWQEHLRKANDYKDKSQDSALKYYLLAKGELVRDSSKTAVFATVCKELGSIYQKERQYNEAQVYFLQSREVRQIVFGKDSREYANACINVGNIYDELDQYREAEALFIEAREIRAKILGIEHRDYAASCVKLANVYYNSQQYLKAEPLYLEAREICAKNLGKEHPDYASSCVDIADVYFALRQYQKAEPLYLEAREIRAKTLGREHPDYVKSCIDLANVYYNSKQYQKAEPLYLEAREIRAKVIGTLHPDYARACADLGDVYSALRQYQKAGLLYLEARAIRAKTLGRKHPDYVKSCIDLANVYYNTEHYLKAEPLYLEAKEIRAKIFGKEHRDYASSCVDLADVYSALQQYQKAEPLYREAKEIRAKTLGKEHPDYAASCNKLGDLYRTVFQYEKAEALLGEAKEIWTKTLGKGAWKYANVCNNLAALYYQMGQYGKAEPLFLEARAIDKTIVGGEWEYANVCNNLALLYHEMGQYDKAEPLYFETKGIREKLRGKKSLAYAESCNNLGILFRDLLQYKKAESFYLEAKEIREKVLGRGHPDYAGSCNNLAVLYDDMGAFDRAEPLYLAAREIWHRVLGKNHPEYARCCDALGILYKDMGQYKKAESLLLEAREIRARTIGKDHPDYAVSCYDLAVLYFAKENTRKADSFFQEAYYSKQKQLEKMLQFTTEAEKGRYLENVLGGNNLYYSFYRQIPHVAMPFSISFQSRNVILQTTQQLRKEVHKSGSLQAVMVYDQWASLKTQLAALYSSNADSNLIHALEDSVSLVEKRLVRLSNSFEKSREPLTLIDIQKSLHVGEVAIEFISYKFNTGKRQTDSTYYEALVLGKEGPPQSIFLFEKRRLDSLLHRSGNSTSNTNAATLYASRGVKVQGDSLHLSKELYNLVWAPIEKALQGIKRVYYAPAGQLYRVAFAALPVSDSQVLSDKYELMQVSSTANIVNQQPLLITASDRVALFGDIRYSADSNELQPAATGFVTTASATPARYTPSGISRGGDGIEWKDLPGTRLELDGIRTTTSNRPITIVSGTGAMEERIKSLQDSLSPAVLHIATHGFYFPEVAKKTASGAFSSERKQVFRTSEDPLFRAGLLFAGANNTWQGKSNGEGREDGILTAYEVSNMYLPNTKLVVLSACETGLGDVQGNEGVYGLQRAFKMAGADALIMSLWQVPDRETAEFMTELYRNLFSGQEVEAAFTHAQTALKNKYRNAPVKWGAWVLVR